MTRAGNAMTARASRIGIQVAEALGQTLSAGLLWCLAMFFFDWATDRRNALSILPFFLVNVITPAAFWLLTFGWRRLLQRRNESGQPVVWTILGLFLFIPPYFMFASYFFSGRDNQSVTEVVKGLLGLYVGLPLSVISITTYQATLPGFCLSVVATLHAVDYARRKPIVAPPQ